MHLAQLLIWEVIPSTGITVQQGRSLDVLLAVFRTSLALVRVVGVAYRCRVELEELPQVVLGEVPCGIFCFIDHAC